MKNTTNFLFVVDTDKYSGNFEREMCAYLTGVLGECEVGSTEADIFKDEVAHMDSVLMEDTVIQVPDEHAVYRPCSIYPTEGRYNNGMGKHFDGEGKWPAYESVAIFFKSQPTQKLIDVMKERACKFATYWTRKREYHDSITIKGFRLLEEKTVVTLTKLDV